MKKRFTEQRIIGILKAPEAENASTSTGSCQCAMLGSSLRNGVTNTITNGRIAS
jgi:hypothetical protein